MCNKILLKCSKLLEIYSTSQKPLVIKRERTIFYNMFIDILKRMGCSFLFHYRKCIYNCNRLINKLKFNEIYVLKKNVVIKRSVKTQNLMCYYQS